MLWVQMADMAKVHDSAIFDNTMRYQALTLVWSSILDGKGFFGEPLTCRQQIHEYQNGQVPDKPELYLPFVLTDVNIT